VLAAAAAAQLIVYMASGSVALLADLIHNFGDALTAIPLAIAFTMRSQLAERRAGLAVVGAIFTSACVAGLEAVRAAPLAHAAASPSIARNRGSDRVRRKPHRGSHPDESR
jgi:divalent metal cation (Fe/Co/Zn/Cd) transporter